MFEKLNGIEKRYEELNLKISDPKIMSNQNEWKKLTKEHADLSEIVEKYREFKSLKNDIEEAKELLHDPEMKSLAQAEFEEKSALLPKIEEEIKFLLLPKDPNDDKNVIMEIRRWCRWRRSCTLCWSFI